MKLTDLIAYALDRGRSKGYLVLGRGNMTKPISAFHHTLDDNRNKESILRTLRTRLI